MIGLAVTKITQKGMVQSRRLKSNTFQGSSMTRNTHNNLLKQELRRIRQFAGFREVLPCSEPCPQKNREVFGNTLIVANSCPYVPKRPNKILYLPKAQLTACERIGDE